MKLFLACLAYAVMGAVLVWGVLLVMVGKPWLLIIGFLAYLLGMIKIGCLSH